MSNVNYSNTLIHWGVKGMRWGVRKDRKSSKVNAKTKTPLTRKQKVKRVAIITGSLLAAAGAAYISKKLYDSKKLDKKTIDLGKKFTEKVLQEPTKILHTSRGKNTGFKFYQDGGVPSPMSLYDQAFGAVERSSGYFNKFDGKIAITFDDPLGRLDRSGRMIPHEVILPKTLAEGVSNFDEAVAKVWPMVKDLYDYI